MMVNTNTCGALPMTRLAPYGLAAPDAGRMSEKGLPFARRDGRQ
jgi:hypothetical protein